jgi:hypothetical protein
LLLPELAVLLEQALGQPAVLVQAVRALLVLGLVAVLLEQALGQPAVLVQAVRALLVLAPVARLPVVVVVVLLLLLLLLLLFRHPFVPAALPQTLVWGRGRCSR